MIFPHPLLADEQGFLCYGGDLEVERLKCAYQFGIFPWYNQKPVLWWFTHPRLVLFPSELKISKSLARLWKTHAYRLSRDEAFEGVIRQCAKINRTGQKGTWLSEEMIRAYIQLHHIGIAHSVEVWSEKKLVGGLYGLVIGKIFCGESMFSTESNTSKLALIHLVDLLKSQDCQLVDCQQETAHLMSLGARCIDKTEFWSYIQKNLLKEPMLFI